MITNSMHPTPKVTKLNPVASILSACLIRRLNGNLRNPLDFDQELFSTDISL